jgi:hypothetical protein
MPDTVVNEYSPTTGIEIYVGELGVEPATRWASVKDVTELPGLTAKKFDTTRLSQYLSDGTTEDRVEQFGFGNLTPGMLRLALGFKEDEVEAGYALVGVNKAWKVLFPGGATLKFNGGVETFAPQGNRDQEVSVNVGIQASSRPVFTPAT